MSGQPGREFHDQGAPRESAPRPADPEGEAGRGVLDGPELEGAVDAALGLLGRGLGFEAHELLEPHWRKARDPLVRGALRVLLHLCAAEHHRQRGNPRGMAGQRRKAVAILEATPVARALDQWPSARPWVAALLAGDAPLAD